jgi:hypothetical protein
MGSAEAIAGRHPGDIDVVLDADRNAVEWSQARIAPRSFARPLGFLRGAGLA